MAGLAQKLETNPNDLEGWLRLLRAYVVLGDQAEAINSFGKAKAAFASQPDALARLEQTARELKIGTAP